jgi:DNA adenine methylase
MAKHNANGGMLSPPLKWAGGKRWLVPLLREVWQPYQERRLIEPFCGGLAVSFGLLPQQATLNDINPHLINFYRHLQLGLTVTIEMRNDADLYYAHRNRFNELIRLGQTESSESAQLFYFLNRTGYNGLCRFNQKGEFNVPFGKYKTINYTTDFSEYSQTLAQWDFQVSKFDALAVDPNNFIYADPPYDVEFVSYSKDGFTWADQLDLVEWLVQHQGPVVLSNQATERIKRLYQDLGFTVVELFSPRRINSTGDRTPALEVLAFRNIPAEIIERVGADFVLA